MIHMPGDKPPTPNRKANMDGSSEYRIVAQRAADAQDPRGTMAYEGPNFSNLVQRAEAEGYPRIIEGDERKVTQWHAIPNFPFAERTP